MSDDHKGLPRVWKATVTYEVYVLPHRADEAADCAKLNRDCYADIGHTGVASAVVVTDIGSVEDPTSLPWVAMDVKNPDHMEDITVREWLERIKKEESK